MFHNGFEWSLNEREKFGERIRRKGWPHDWFSTATRDDKPWIFYLSEQYIEHCLEMFDEVLDAVGGFIRDDEFQSLKSPLSTSEISPERSSRHPPAIHPASQMERT